MAQFVGKRIIPRHEGVWSIKKAYEPLVIVLDETTGDSYMSRRDVPAGTELDNASYWAKSGVFNAQLKETHDRMNEDFERKHEAIDADLEAEKQHVEETVAGMREELTHKEALLTSQTENAVNLSNKNRADLETRMAQIEKRQEANVTASTDKDADYAAEVVDARVSQNGTAYAGIGAHIRAIETGDALEYGALSGYQAGFMEIPLNLTFVENRYINYKSGEFCVFTVKDNVYWATEEFIPFPYGGAHMYLRAAKDKAQTDVSGLAFYDETKQFISGMDYNRDNGLVITEFVCPKGTAYIRLSCRGAQYLDRVKLWLADMTVSRGCLSDDSVEHRSLCVNAASGENLSVMEITPDWKFEPDQYIAWRSGVLNPYKDKERLYFATPDFIPFPYAGIGIVLRASKSIAESDKSGIAFYDAGKQFISGSDYNRASSNLEYTRLVCPDGTAYIRLSCYREKNVPGVRVWADDVRVPEGRLVSASVTEEKLRDGAVSGKKLAENAVSGKHIGQEAVSAVQTDFLRVPVNLVFVPDKYIARSGGKLADFTQNPNTYFATEEFVPFPYGGSRCIVRARMSLSGSDLSGMAFYDADKNFLAGVKYAQEDGGMCLTEFDCPIGTAFMRMTMYGASYVAKAALWFKKVTVAADNLVQGAVTKEKLDDELRMALGDQTREILGLSIPDEPLQHIRETPGLLSVFHTVGCIGDSLASGESVYKKADGSIGYYDDYPHSWGQYLAKLTGNKYYNWSRGGLRADTFLASRFATECFDGEHKCEAYIIGLGQNENNHKYTVGAVTDIDLQDYNNNAVTYYGNYGKIIQKIKEVQPKAKIFVLTDPLQAVERAGYNDAVREIATLFTNVYLLDFHRYAAKYFSSGLISVGKRGGHYNAVGYYLCALLIASYIDWYMKKIPEEFREIEYIGTDFSYYG